MARCYLTGVEFRLHEGFFLNPAAANRVLRSLRSKIEEIQRLIDQLGQYDAVEIHDKSLKHKISRRGYRRLVCRPVAEALAAVCPEEHLFLSWQEYRYRWPAAHKNESDKDTTNEGEE